MRSTYLEEFEEERLRLRAFIDGEAYSVKLKQAIEEHTAQRDTLGTVQNMRIWLGEKGCMQSEQKGAPTCLNTFRNMSPVSNKPSPPRWAQRLLLGLHLAETIEKRYAYWHNRAGRHQATLSAQCRISATTFSALAKTQTTIRTTITKPTFCYAPQRS